MIEKRQDALARVQEKAFQAFEKAANQNSRLCDISLLTQPSFDDWDVWHVWVPAEQGTSQAVRVLWRRVFDVQRFGDPMMGLKYGWKEVPTLEMSYHIVDHDMAQKHAAALIGAVPVESFPRGMVLDGVPRHLKLRLPLGDVSLSWNMGQGEWQRLTQCCEAFHEWVLTTPALKS